MLVKYGARLEDVDGEESPLEYLCRWLERGMDCSHLDFVLDHATRENVSLEHVERVISATRLEAGRTEGMIAELYRITVYKLHNFREREFSGEMMTGETEDVDADDTEQGIEKKD
ncbi:hypothetical protein J3F84DRAFT_152173 [Trichoderma pleuroticola]